MGSFAWQVGDFMDILNFHAQRGFAFVEEEALELTHTEKLKKEPHRLKRGTTARSSWC